MVNCAVVKERSLFMYSKEQKDIALRIYHQTESVTETIRILGYPTRRNLYTWIAEENTPPKTRKEYPVINNLAILH